MLYILVLIGVVIEGLLSCDSAAARPSVPAEFSEDGRMAVVQTAGDLAIWDIEAKPLAGKVPQIQCDQVGFLKQDGWVLCAGNGVTIYDWKRQMAVAKIPPEGKQAMRVLAYSREADRMVVRQGNEAVS
jgi:hypothetical protein